MLRTKAKGLHHLDPDSTVFTEGWLPAEGIVEAIGNRQFFILLSNMTTKQELFDKHEVMGHLNDDISTNVSAEAP